jgi:hypothetical protein
MINCILIVRSCRKVELIAQHIQSCENTEHIERITSHPMGWIWHSKPQHQVQKDIQHHTEIANAPQTMTTTSLIPIGCNKGEHTA